MSGAPLLPPGSGYGPYALRTMRGMFAGLVFNLDAYGPGRWLHLCPKGRRPASSGDSFGVITDGRFGYGHAARAYGYAARPVNGRAWMTPTTGAAWSPISQNPASPHHQARGAAPIPSDDRGAWICRKCGFRGFWSGVHCL
jgi:hypothetical protein